MNYVENFYQKSDNSDHYLAKLTPGEFCFTFIVVGMFRGDRANEDELAH